MLRGFPRPPVWAVVVMAAGLVFLIAAPRLAPAHHDPVSPAQAARMSAAEKAAEVSDRVNAPVQVLVVGDSYTSGSGMGGNGPANWTQLVGQKLIAAGQPVTITASAGGGSGYTQGGTRNMTFDQLLTAGGKGFDVVVVFGSRNDVDPAAVGPAARKVLADAKSLSPNARLLVVGPPWVDGDPPDYIVGDRDAVQAAAKGAGVQFVDPLADGWFTGADSRLIGSDGVHPTDAGHAYMADRMLPALQAQVTAARQARG